MPSNPLTPTASAIVVTTAMIVTLALLAWRFDRLRGTTLIAPWCWCAIAVLGVDSVELLALRATLSPASLQFLRLVAAALTVCPAISLLGAKRPQDRPWQFVVFSLWLVLCLPSAQAVLFGSRSLLLETIWNVFLAIVLLAGLLNHLFTRYWPSALLLFLAQIVLLAPRLPWIHRWQFEGGAIVGLLLLTSAVAVARCLPRRHDSPGWNRVWHDWRDAFGLLWGLRVADRFNSTAEQQDWNLVLQWDGFIDKDRESNKTIDLTQPAASSFRMLLRRFVPPEWIEQRLKQ